MTDEIESAEEFAESLWIEETDDPPPHHYAVMIAKRDAAIAAKARTNALQECLRIASERALRRHAHITDPHLVADGIYTAIRMLLENQK